MRIIFADHAWADYLYWLSNDRQVLKRINLLIEATRRDPTGGIGKPEALRGNRAGYWSRRITEEHRMVYRVEGEDLPIAALRYHY